METQHIFIDKNKCTTEEVCHEQRVHAWAATYYNLPFIDGLMGNGLTGTPIFCEDKLNGNSIGYKAHWNLKYIVERQLLNSYQNSQFLQIDTKEFESWSVKIDINECIHLKELSRYNHNYYELPIHLYSIGNNILYESYNGADEFEGNVIGYLTDTKEFIPVRYLNVDDIDDEIFLIESSNLSLENKIM